MKPSKIGVVAAAILLVATGIGFGIAQAGATHSERPILSFQDMESLEQVVSLSSSAETRPVLAFEDASSPYADARPVLSFEDQEAYQVTRWPLEAMQLESSIETGSSPAEINADSSIVEIEGVSY